MSLSTAWLLGASILYIELPIGIFLLGWVNPIISVPLVLLLVLQLIFFFKAYSSKTKAVHIPILHVVAGLVIALIWVVLSGAGHRGEFNGDYFKHNAILNDLIRLSWPAHYVVNGTKTIVYLVYYIAYYLPAALFGKAYGWQAANLFLFFWTYAGVALTLGWFFRFFQKKSIYAFILFILFSGIDYLGRLILFHRTGVNPDWEWWAGQWQYSGVTTLLFHVPQHALAAWIFVSVLLTERVEIATLFSAVLLWSPFVWVGSIPIVIAQAIQKKIKFSLMDTLTGMLIICVLGAYLASNQYSQSSTEASGQWLWQRVDIMHSFTFVRLIIFYLFEFGIFFGIIKLVKPLFLKNGILLFITVVTLLFIPWYRMGLLNDFAMRASIPGLFVIALFFIHAALEAKKHMSIAALCIIMLAALYPIVQFQNGIIHFSIKSPQTQLTHLDTPQVRMQYLGTDRSFFFHTVSKEKEPTVAVMNLKQ
jgi:hypothetical protein